MKEENKNKDNIVTHAMYAGLVMGGILACIYFLQLQFCSNLPAVSLFLSFIIFATTIYCVYHYTSIYNRNLLNGSITYFKAVNFGMHLFFFASMILAIFFYFYFQFVNPHVLQKTIESSIAIINQSNGSLTESERFTMQSSLSSMNATNFALSSLWSFFFMGTILTLFTSFSFRSKKNNVI